MQRNVGNQAAPTDLNLSACLEYGVGALQVGEPAAHGPGHTQGSHISITCRRVCTSAFVPAYVRIVAAPTCGSTLLGSCMPAPQLLPTMGLTR